MFRIIPDTIGKKDGTAHYVRGYATDADRKRAISALRNHGFGYFVPYGDTQAEFALYAIGPRAGEA